MEKDLWLSSTGNFREASYAREWRLVRLATDGMSIKKSRHAKTSYRKQPKTKAAFCNAVKGLIPSQTAARMFDFVSGNESI